jgi:hypothetical protein
MTTNNVVIIYEQLNLSNNFLNLFLDAFSANESA